MNPIEELLRAHLKDVREQIALANARADSLEALIDRVSTQSTISASAAQPVARKMPNGWSEQEDELLRQNYELIGAAGCMKLLPHRSNMAIRVRASRNLGLVCLPSAKKIWCGQCESKVTQGQAASCASRFCKAKAVAA